MKRLARVVALLCCLNMLVVACGEEPDEDNTVQNQNNGDDDDNDDDDDNGDDDNADNGDDDNGDNGDDDNGDNGDPPDELHVCVNECGSAADCGEADEWACDDGACSWDDGASEPGCESDAECVAQQMGWGPCEEQEHCQTANNEACVEYDGQGYCALLADDVDCEAAFAMDELTVDLVGEAGEETICIDEDRGCSDAQCVDLCDSDDDCESQSANDTCLDGVCGCGSNEACEVATGADICFDGTCGCSEDEICGDDRACVEM